MINIYEVLETNKMIEQENLDVRTITMGINLLDCVDSDVDALCRKIYDKITRLAKDLVKTGEDISKEYGIPIVNKRVSITPVSLVGGSACRTPEDYVKVAHALDRAAKEVGINFLGGYTSGFGRNGTHLQFCECRINENRYQYGCCETDGRDYLADGRADERQGFFGLC